MRTHLRLIQICIFMMEDCDYEERLSISLTVEFFSGHFRLPNNNYFSLNLSRFSLDYLDGYCKN